MTARRRYRRPSQQNLAGQAARLARKVNGQPEQRQTRREKKAAKRARRQ